MNLQTAVFVLLLSAPVVAQYATANTFAPACQPPFGQGCSITCTPPVLGSNVAVTTNGPHMSYALLLLSMAANYQGVSLTPYGSPGCLLYASPSAGVVVPQSLFSGHRTHTFPIPAGLGSGIQFFAQALLTNGGPASASMLTSNLIVATTGAEPDLTPAQIAGFAPIARLHPNETWFPMDPLQFVQLSRFRHHRGLLSDEGYNKVSNTWVVSNSHAQAYYDIPVGFVNSYGLNANGTNRRPRDPNSGSSWNVFLQSNGPQHGIQFPVGTVPVFYHYRRELASASHIIQFWWFFGYNDSAASFNHQGDWEHVTVWVSSGNVVGCYFAAHNGGEYKTNTQMTMIGGRPVVYIAKGSHAAYAAPGTYNFGFDHAANGGLQWDVALRLERLETQPWKDFAGAWGEVGATSTTTGPLGPWFKRFNP